MLITFSLMEQNRESELLNFTTTKLQVIYAAPTSLPPSMGCPSQADKVVYYATSAPLASMTHLEIPPQLLQLQVSIDSKNT